MRLQGVLLFFLILSAVSTSAEAEARWLVFTSYRDGNAEIYRVDNRGEQLQNLTRHPADDMHAIWSPDGTKILFVSNRDERWGIYRMNADGTHLQLLVHSEYEIDTLAFSPDGSKISYITHEVPRYSKTHLMIMSSTGENSFELTQDVRNAAWMPDGQNLFGHIVDNTLLLSIDANTGEQTLYDGFYAGSFSISPDGTQLAYDYGGEFSNIEIWDFASDTITLLPGKYPNSEFSDRGAKWSPDGMLIAYMSQRSYGVYNIYITEPDENFTPYLLVNQEDFYNIYPEWSPDSAQLAFLAAPGDDEYDFENDAFDVYVVDVNGANLVNISNHPARDVEPQWQPVTEDAP